MTRLAASVSVSEMSRAVLAAQKRMDDAAFPVRVKVSTGERGIDMLTITQWLQDELPLGEFAYHSQHGPRMIDGVMFYFRSVTDAQRFLSTFPDLVLADGTELPGYTSLAKEAGGRTFDRRGHSVPATHPDPEPTNHVDTEGEPVDFPQMCNRYARGERDAVLNLFDIKKISTFNEGPRIIHPREPGPVVRIHEGALTLEQMTWGFPVVLQGKRGQPLKPRPVNNARFDKLGKFWRRWAENPAQRCLIPTASYAEAVGEPRQMTCTWLSLKSMPVFAWAGLWSVSEEWGQVYTGVMTDNAPELGHIHDRSPVILAPEDWQTWLTAPLADLYRFDRPWPAEDVMVEQTNVAWKIGGQIEAYPLP